MQVANLLISRVFIRYYRSLNEKKFMLGNNSVHKSNKLCTQR